MVCSFRHSRRGLTGYLVVFLLLSLLPGCARASSGNGTDANVSQRTSNEQGPPATKQGERKPAQPTDPDKFALVIAGVGGEESYTKKFTGLATSLYETLTNELSFDPKNTSLLTEGLAGDPENAIAPPPEANPSRRSTAEEVRAAFNALKSTSRPGNLILVVLVGHGSFDNQQAKFNLIGPDLSAKDYAELMSGLGGRRIVFINCASSSGEFLKPLSGENRVIITATRSGNEQNATVFGEHLLAALGGGAADADKNGRTSVLEAFNYATKVTADWYKQKNRLATEHALIDDNGDGKGAEDANTADGSLAKLVYLDSKSLIEAGGNADVAKLLQEKQRLEEAVEKLKTQKDKMKPEEYEAQLEKLLVELAQINQTIKGRK